MKRLLAAVLLAFIGGCDAPSVQQAKINELADQCVLVKTIQIATVSGKPTVQAIVVTKNGVKFYVAYPLAGDNYPSKGTRHRCVVVDGVIHLGQLCEEDWPLP